MELGLRGQPGSAPACEGCGLAWLTQLVSRLPQQVAIPGAGIVASFAAGESIWTESSCKYTLAGIASLGTAAGFRLREQWLDTDAGFALSLFQSARG